MTQVAATPLANRCPPAQLQRCRCLQPVGTQANLLHFSTPCTACRQVAFPGHSTEAPAPAALLLVQLVKEYVDSGRLNKEVDFSVDDKILAAVNA